MSIKTIKYAALLCCLAGLALIIWPYLHKQFGDTERTQVSQNYRVTVKDMNSQIKSEEITAAEQYNQDLRNGTVSTYDPFDREGEQAGMERYNSLLATDQDGVMSVLSIDAIDLEIPVYHGTSSDTLRKGAGHVDWTSLPVGGSGTHCVIAAHSSDPDASSFNNLEKLKEGDTFEISTMDNRYAYQIDRIKTVLPDDVADFIEFEDGQDYATLLTCTPHNINSHRLLVRGHRIDAPLVDDTPQMISLEPVTFGVVIAASLMAGAVSIIILGTLFGRRRGGSVPRRKF